MGLEKDEALAEKIKGCKDPDAAYAVAAVDGTTTKSVTSATITVSASAGAAGAV